MDEREQLTEWQEAARRVAGLLALDSNMFVKFAPPPQDDVPLGECRNPDHLVELVRDHLSRVTTMRRALQGIAADAKIAIHASTVQP